MEEESVEKGMTPILLEDLGMKFATDKSKEKKRYGLYQCQYCGKEFEARLQNVKHESTRSCGCQSKKYRNPHGLYKHRLFQTWDKMMARCYNIKNKSYKNYGGRGIKVCDKWLDVVNFIEDMYPTWEEGLSLDRIDVNGNYCPENCRWADKYTQAQNTRDIYKNNTSGFRGVSFIKLTSKWLAYIRIKGQVKNLGYYPTALEAAKAYETYVRLNNLEHNFTPALNEEEVKDLELKQK